MTKEKSSSTSFRSRDLRVPPVSMGPARYTSCAMLLDIFEHLLNVLIATAYTAVIDHRFNLNDTVVTKNFSKKKTEAQHGTPFMDLWHWELGSYLIAPDVVSYSSMRSFPQGTKDFFFAALIVCLFVFLGAMWCECNAVFFQMAIYLSQFFPPNPSSAATSERWVGKSKPRVGQGSTELLRFMRSTAVGVHGYRTQYRKAHYVVRLISTMVRS